MTEKVNKSVTRQFKVVFPNTLNDHDTLFGGTAMKWMDEVAYITATRFVRKKMVTTSCDKVQFLSPMRSGTIAEIIGTVINVGNATIEVKVEIFVEDMVAENRQKAVNAIFSFAAIDENNKPVPIGMNNIKSQMSSYL